ncbi:MAG: hypothetical protein JST22_12710 [Bacteroidetes bacterium]|nr:hypothetical protein [Bacteroidota bacterium]
MSEFPGAARVMKGAIIGIDGSSPLSRIVRFQYNPESVLRSLTPRTGPKATPSASGADATAKETYKLTGPPAETISLDLHLDAADQLEIADPIAVGFGLHPQLASLELLLYPKLDQLKKQWAKLDKGVAEVQPMEAPVTLFFWGVQRVQPVRVKSLSVTESNFDSKLNPIQAVVKVELETLSYDELTGATKDLYVVYQQAKEVLATLGGLRTVTSALLGV